MLFIQYIILMRSFLSIEKKLKYLRHIERFWISKKPTKKKVKGHGVKYQKDSNSHHFLWFSIHDCRPPCATQRDLDNHSDVSFSILDS